MSVLSSRRPHRSWLSNLPAIADWPDLLAGSSPCRRGARFEDHLIRVEDHIEDGHYILRAELPGVDPAKDVDVSDVDVSVRDGPLTIKAERTEKKEEATRSEFRYGSFYRSNSLPAGAKEDDIAATYTDGILPVSIPVTAPQTPEKRIEVHPVAATESDHT